MNNSLNFKQYGNDKGRLVIYFHGVPGAPEECAIFDDYGKKYGLNFICFNRFSVDSAITNEAYYQYLSLEILKKSENEKVDVIGFSIGAFIALQTCRHMQDKVRSLHLISAAAPLEADNFLPNMAGKQVFQLAKTLPSIFVLFSHWQRLFALILPNTLFRILFASATGQDKVLAKDKTFQSSITKVLSSCFINHLSGYIRDIKAYVCPWKATLPGISINTYIWHGKQDNWSPERMAQYLKQAIPECKSIKIFDGLSHYSCLHQAAPEICTLLHDDEL